MIEKQKDGTLKFTRILKKAPKGADVDQENIKLKDLLRRARGIIQNEWGGCDHLPQGQFLLELSKTDPKTNEKENDD